ncbi:MAG: L,D-transpeptidase, partial [Gammaproteobacteria bacterium]
PQEIDAPNEKVIMVDLNLHAWGAYDSEGTLIRWGPATGGADWCRDIGRSCRTKSGTFRIYSLGSSSCVSTKFPIPRGGAPMPYCMFFNGGQALHGSPGQVIKDNASHGCVRLFVDDAEWLRYDFVDPPMEENNYRGTKVVVLPYPID